MLNRFCRVKTPVILLLCAALFACALSCAQAPGAAESDGDAEQTTGFAPAYADFAVELLKRSGAGSENTLLSPLSLMLALTMTANGACEETLAQMEAVVGGGIPIEQLNKYLMAYAHSLFSGEEARLHIANSVWFRDDPALTVMESFLALCRREYGAQVERAAFDNDTADAINAWVNEHTDGMINGIVEEIPEDAVLYLINALAFDAEWKVIYPDVSIRAQTFTSINGEKRWVDFMGSFETLCYDGEYGELAAGFVKPYKSGYSFMALLPNENVSLGDYIASLTGARFLEIYATASQKETIGAGLPKFSYAYEELTEVKEWLKDMGMPIAFDVFAADFTDMALHKDGNICISNILHKTFIAVDERGTMAGAASAVEMQFGGTPKAVMLDRPFVYAIIDNKAGLPVFIGTVTDIN